MTALEQIRSVEHDAAKVHCQPKLRTVADALRSFGAAYLAAIVDEAADALEAFVGSGLYSIGTWDGELGAFTPQEGCVTPWLNVNIHGLRRHLKELRAQGYQCHRNADDSDASVLVERTDGEPELKVRARWLAS